MKYFLVWSNQHRQWWAPGKLGYVDHIERAGRYPREQAEDIVARSTLDGRLEHRAISPAGKAYTYIDEVMVLAPESTEPEIRTLRAAADMLEEGGFRCPKCGLVSQHPEDKRQGYCGACHEFTDQ